ncbi:hypothetical protein Krac_0563 [Ktedonobacter racemifer DSM 44963]|uniref:Uncharacterized protein n=1 Tax=Ktedonobacter racemifer DSM 44963 TaxID=485913 RepID=D6U814_KTERA|nr:hypothetical protein Krac_0563 [Ktedonobacter racemifer DSM 44963]
MVIRMDNIMVSLLRRTLPPECRRRQRDAEVIKMFKNVTTPHAYMKRHAPIGAPLRMKREYQSFFRCFRILCWEILFRHLDELVKPPI